LEVVRKLLGDRSCQRRLTVVNVTNSTDVTVRFITLKLFLSHKSGPRFSKGHYPARFLVARGLLRLKRKIKPEMASTVETLIL